MRKVPKKGKGGSRKKRISKRPFAAAPEKLETPETVSQDSSLDIAVLAPPLPGNHALLSPPSEPGADASVLDRLWILIENRKDADPKVSHAARLLARGTTSVAQKLGEEAVECIVELVAGRREGLIAESADVLYHLLIAWADAGVRPDEVWVELQRRERASLVGENAAAAGRKRPAIRRVLGRARAELRTTKIP